MTVYLANAFPDWTFTVVSIVLLAAAMSTLDGLLVSISTITANDLVINLINKFSKKEISEEQKMKLSFRVSHLVLIVIAIMVFVVNINPPKLLGIYGQVGVYGLVLAALAPLLVGVLLKNSPLKLLWTSSILAIITHFVLYFYGNELFPNSGFTFANPSVTAVLSIILVIFPTLVIAWFLNKKIIENE